MACAGVGQAFQPAGSGDCQSPGPCGHPERPRHPSISADWKARRPGRLESLPYIRRHRPTPAHFRPLLPTSVAYFLCALRNFVVHPRLDLAHKRRRTRDRSGRAGLNKRLARTVIVRTGPTRTRTPIRPAPRDGAIPRRAGFLACRFRGLSVPRTVRTHHGTGTPGHLGGLESPPNWQAGKPALQPTTSDDDRVTGAACYLCVFRVFVVHLRLGDAQKAPHPRPARATAPSLVGQAF